MCSIIAHDKQQPTYVDDEISAGGRPIPNHLETEVLESLVATLNFIYCSTAYLPLGVGALMGIASLISPYC